MTEPRHVFDALGGLPTWTADSPPRARQPFPYPAMGGGTAPYYKHTALDSEQTGFCIQQIKSDPREENSSLRRGWLAGSGALCDFANDPSARSAGDLAMNLTDAELGRGSKHLDFGNDTLRDCRPA